MSIELLTIRLFLFSDIHANLPALEAIQRAVKAENPDLVIHLEDAVDMGPHPAEVLSALVAQPDWLCLQGNHEQFMFGYEREGTDALELEHRSWTRSQLDQAHFRMISQWQRRVEMTLDGLALCFQHYALNPDTTSPLSFCPYFEPEAAVMDNKINGSAFDLIFFGHLHRPVRAAGVRAQYYGLMASGTGPKAEAAYTLADLQQGQAQVLQKTIAYDDTGLFADMEARQVPAREFLYEAFYGGRFRSGWQNRAE